MLYIYLPVLCYHGNLYVTEGVYAGGRGFPLSQRSFLFCFFVTFVGHLFAFYLFLFSFITLWRYTGWFLYVSVGYICYILLGMFQHIHQRLTWGATAI